MHRQIRRYRERAVERNRNRELVDGRYYSIAILMREGAFVDRLVGARTSSKEKKGGNCSQRTVWFSSLYGSMLIILVSVGRQVTGATLWKRSWPSKHWSARACRSLGENGGYFFFSLSLSQILSLPGRATRVGHRCRQKCNFFKGA